MLNPELRKKIKELQLNYKDEVQPELLIPIPNRYRRNYEIVTQTDEFTSLCPLNAGQPDYAHITIRYVPDEYLIELKSLKFYYGSYRTVMIFHEDIANKMLDDLVAAIKPLEMTIEAAFTIRGGLHTTVIAEYSKPINKNK